MKRTSLAVFFLLVVLVGCSSQSGGTGAGHKPTPTLTPTATPYPHWAVGDTVKTDTWALTIVSIKEVPESGSSTLDLVIEITAQNLTAVPHNISLFYFDLRDANGNTAKTAVLDTYPFFGGDVADHATAHGFFGFEVSPSAKQFTLTYSDFRYLLIWDLSV